VVVVAVLVAAVVEVVMMPVGLMVIVKADGLQLSRRQFDQPELLFRVLLFQVPKTMQRRGEKGGLVQSW
jgi:hypothetical protein